MTGTSAPATLVEHFFRHESGRLTAVLTRRFGAHRLDLIEDAIQCALERAIGAWTRHGIPDEPAAWLTRVAHNALLDQLRREKSAEASLVYGVLAEAASEASDAPPRPGEDSLVLLFACAHEKLAPRTRLVLCLKLLSGFSTEEIATRLYMSPANVQKTLERGRQHLRQCWDEAVARPLGTGAPDPRLETVQLVLYLQFNEGYSLGSENDGLRVELCEEAIRLTRMLVGHPVGDQPSSWALLALMHFHASRLPARLSVAGDLITLEQQDRSLWDAMHIQSGFECMQRATSREDFSRFHGEAAVQVEHILASSFDATRWQEIVELYAALEQLQPSPVYALNRAIAVAEAHGPEAGLQTLSGHEFPAWFTSDHLYQGALGELCRRTQRWQEAEQHLKAAIDSAPSRPERQLFEQRLRLCSERCDKKPGAE